MWPTNQKDIERKIFNYFVREMRQYGFDPMEVHEGGTAELDFRVLLPRGEIYLELMEVVVPAIGSVPFQSEAQKHDCIEFAEEVFRNVQKKIDKYGHKHETPVHLLLYITHEQYIPADSGYAALRRLFLDRKHPFELVLFMAPIAEDDTPLMVIANRDDPVSAPTLEELKGQCWISIPSTSIELDRS